jgi:hypothetical protein
LTFDTNKRQELQLEYENERLDEVQDLFTEGRSANVDFKGYVTRLSADEWRVSGITVFISPETRLPDQQVVVGTAVRIHGQVLNGGVVAVRIELLPPGYTLPEVGDGVGQDGQEDQGQPTLEDSGAGSENEATGIGLTATATPIFTPENVSLKGVVASIENNFIVINGILMDIQLAEIVGTPSVGVIAEVEGYYNFSGVFIVTRIVFRTAGLNDNELNLNNVGDDGINNSNINELGGEDIVDNSNDGGSNDNSGEVVDNGNDNGTNEVDGGNVIDNGTDSSGNTNDNSGSDGEKDTTNNNGNSGNDFQSDNDG